MMVRWAETLLGRAIRHRKEFVTIDDASLYKRCRVQLHAQGIVLRDFVEGARIKTKSQQVCRAGDFLVAEIDAKVGGYGIVPEDLGGAVVSGHYFLFEVDGRILDRKFLEYYARTAAFREQVAPRGSTNYAAIRPHQVLAYTIPLPPLDEQRRIVARVEALAGKITEARRLRQEARAERVALVSSLNENWARGRVIALGDLLVLDEDRVLVVPEGVYPQVGLRGFGGGLFAKSSVGGSETTYRAFNRLYPGALVVSQVKGWEGAVAVAAEEFAGRFASPEYRTFRSRKGALDPEYLAALVATPWFCARLSALTRGVGARRERIRPEMFLSLRIPAPALEAQRQAVGLFRRLTKLSASDAEAEEAILALLPSVLDRAIRGEL